VIEPRIQYARTADGVNVAFFVLGEGQTLVLMPTPPLGHIGPGVAVPSVSAWLEGLAGMSRLLIYDGRGSWLSDREVEDLEFSIDTQILDLEAVVSHIGAERFAILAHFDSTPAAIAYASRCPERLTHLVLWCGYASGAEQTSTAEFEAMMALIDKDWDVFTQFFANLVMAPSPPDEIARLTECVRESATPAAFRNAWRAAAEFDVAELLPRLAVPTLVMDRQGSRSLELSRKLASKIKGAELCLLDTAGMAEWAGDIPSVVHAIQRFVVPSWRARAEPGVSVDDATIVVSTPALSAFAEGRYLVRRLLGEGGQKTAYLVHDQVLNRDCALSLLRHGMLKDESVQRFRREARAMAGIGTHANIVAVFDFGDEGGRPFLVCEYVTGGDLRSELTAAGGPLSVERALSIARDVATGLAAAHGRGVIHRDLKPENVWLSDQGRAKLGDFGLASITDALTLTVEGAMMGTPAYMSPEQSLGGEIDGRSDLYSLGAMLYEMTTGRPPFVGKDTLSIISQHVNAAPEPPSRHNTLVTSDLDSFILRLLAKAPDARPASALILLEELTQVTSTDLE
jgi:pimeloyl-ACP methyl ester carboxylesterase